MSRVTIYSLDFLNFEPDSCSMSSSNTILWGWGGNDLGEFKLLVKTYSCFRFINQNKESKIRLDELEYGEQIIFFQRLMRS